MAARRKLKSKLQWPNLILRAFGPPALLNRPPDLLNWSHALLNRALTLLNRSGQLIIGRNISYTRVANWKCSSLYQNEKARCLLLALCKLEVLLFVSKRKSSVFANSSVYNNYYGYDTKEKE